MYAALLGTYIVVVASIVSALRYEDNPLHFKHHLASDFTEVNETLFVKTQSKRGNWGPEHRCQAMTKAPQNESEVPAHFVYRLMYGNSRNDTQAFNTTLTTGKTEPHESPNTLVYHSHTDGQSIELKLLFCDLPNGCFIVVAYNSSNGRGCRLFQTESTVNRPIPQVCLRVYRENCPRSTVQIYYPFCKTLLADYLP
uniref:Salivary lipocalin n=1 Tax=Amblyomma variegatum TaxID=34610 RepID=F0J9T4_AMBVA|nr:TPA_inf: salivary lipocalin [Amblyomma variegatum]